MFIFSVQYGRHSGDMIDVDIGCVICSGTWECSNSYPWKENYQSAEHFASAGAGCAGEISFGNCLYMIWVVVAETE